MQALVRLRLVISNSQGANLVVWFPKEIPASSAAELHAAMVAQDVELLVGRLQRVARETGQEWEMEEVSGRAA